MKLTGKLVGASKDFSSGKMRIILEVNENSVVEKFFDDERKIELLDITTEKHRVKRSLNANAYFHTIVSQIAEKLKDSTPRVKNSLMFRYGVYQLDEDGKRWMLSTPSDLEEQMIQREDIHLWVCGHGYVNDKQFTHYQVLMPTHEMDSKQFSRLLEGTLQEAESLGIQTITPDEMARLIATWKGGK